MSRSNARLGALALSCAALAAWPAVAGSSSGQADADGAAYARTLSNTLNSEVRNAQIQRAQGDFSGAVRTLSQLMLASPDDPRVVSEYGKVLVQQGRAGEAVQFLSRAVELQPADWTLYSALGVAYDQTGNSANARKAYERALVLKPGEAVVLNNYALSRMQAGDLAEAHRLLSQAAAGGSPNPQIARNLTLLQGLGAAPMQTPAVTPTIAGGTPKLTPYTEMTSKPLPAVFRPGCEPCAKTIARLQRSGAEQSKRASDHRHARSAGRYQSRTGDQENGGDKTHNGQNRRCAHYCETGRSTQTSQHGDAQNRTRIVGQQQDSITAIGRRSLLEPDPSLWERLRCAWSRRSAKRRASELAVTARIDSKPLPRSSA